MNFMVMERRLFTFCFLAVVVWQSVVFAAGTPSFTALTSSLDEAIEAHRHYVAVREGRIARLKRQVLDTDTANISFFRWNGEIYKEYKAYICDSAIHYLRVNLDWAERYGRQDAALETRLERASSNIENSRGFPIFTGPVKSSPVAIIRTIASIKSSTY